MKKKYLIYSVLGVLCIVNLGACTQDDFLIEENENIQKENDLLLGYSLYNSVPYYFSHLVGSCSPASSRVDIERVVTDWIYRSYTLSSFYGIAYEKGKKIRMIAITPRLRDPGVYHPSISGNGWMDFRTIDTMEDEFPEEFIHFVQDIIHNNGISSYTSTGKIDIEFEAKVIYDLSKIGEGWMGPNRGIGLKHADQYLKWIDYMGHTVLTFDMIMEGYNGISYQDFLEDFGNKKAYTGTIANITPELLYYFFYYK